MWLSLITFNSFVWTYSKELPAKPIMTPHSEYKHILYIYPESVNFSNTNFRNIACMDK